MTPLLPVMLTRKDSTLIGAHIFVSEAMTKAIVQHQGKVQGLAIECDHVTEPNLHTEQHVYIMTNLFTVFSVACSSQ